MKHPVRKIVVGVGTVSEEDPVLAAAAWLAQTLGASLHAVHAFEYPPIFGYGYRMQYAQPEARDYYREGIEAAFESQIRKLSRSGRIQAHVAPGPPAQLLTRVVQEVQADLIVVGATRWGRLGRVLLGTTAQRVMRAAPVPVLVLRGPIPQPLERVLLTTDLSAFSAQAHERGCDLVETLGGTRELRSLLVVWFNVPLPPPLAGEGLGEIAQAQLADFLARRQPRPTSIEARVRVGEPAQEIIAEAAQWDADLIVAGTHSRRDPNRFLLGSVAEATVRGAPCNVLVIPPGPVGSQEEEAPEAEEVDLLSVNP